MLFPAHGTIEQTVRDDATLTTAAIPPRANESIAQHELVSRCLCEGETYEGTKMHAGQWHKRPTARAGAGVPGTLPLTVCPVQLQLVMRNNNICIN